MIEEITFLCQYFVCSCEYYCLMSIVRGNLLILISDVCRGSCLGKKYYAMCTKMRLAEASPVCS
jgi:hypothetical protein